MKGVQAVVLPSTAAQPSQPPSANGASALASLVDKVLNGYAAPKSEREVKNEASLGSAAPISRIAATVEAIQDEDDNWDFGDTTEPSVASVESQVLPPGEPDLAAEPSLDGKLTDSVTANPGAREEIPPPPLQGPAPVVPWASELPTGSSAASIAEDADQELDEDAELMAIIAAAKARADDVPPPPPPHFASTAPTTSELAAASRVESTQNESGQELDEDAELMAIIAAAKARADDVPPPPPPHFASTAPTTSESPRISGLPTQDEPDQDLDDDAALMALIAAAKARADDVPPPPPPLSASAMPTALESPLAPSELSHAGEAEQDDDAELMALIAAAKARADDIPPPPRNR